MYISIKVKTYCKNRYNFINTKKDKTNKQRYIVDDIKEMRDCKCKSFKNL